MWCPTWSMARNCRFPAKHVQHGLHGVTVHIVFIFPIYIHTRNIIYMLWSCAIPRQNLVWCLYHKQYRLRSCVLAVAPVFIPYTGVEAMREYGTMKMENFMEKMFTQMTLLSSARHYKFNICKFTSKQWNSNEYLYTYSFSFIFIYLKSSYLTLHFLEFYCDKLKLILHVRFIE